MSSYNFSSKWSVSMTFSNFLKNILTSRSYSCSLMIHWRFFFFFFEFSCLLRGTRDQIANICWIMEKAREFHKNIYFCFTEYAKVFVWITINRGIFCKRWEYQTTLPASWEIYMQVKKQQLKPNMEQQTGSKLGKEYVKALYCHPAYLTYVQSTSWAMPGCMKHKLESRLPGEKSITSDTQMIPPLWQKVKKD